MPAQIYPRRGRPGIIRLLAVQSCVGVVFVIVAMAVAGRAAAMAAALGAASYLLPQAGLAWRVFRRWSEEDPGASLRALYVGEGVKLLSIVVALAAIFRVWPGVPPLPLVLALIVVQAAHWCAPLMLER